MSSTSRLKWKCLHRSKNRPGYSLKPTTIIHKQQSLNSDSSTWTLNGSIDKRHTHHCVRSSSSLSMPITYSKCSSQSILLSDRRLIWQFIVNLIPIKNLSLFLLPLLMIIIIATTTVSTEKASQFLFLLSFFSSNRWMCTSHNYIDAKRLVYFDRVCVCILYVDILILIIDLDFFFDLIFILVIEFSNYRLLRVINDMLIKMKKSFCRNHITHTSSGLVCQSPFYI